MNKISFLFILFLASCAQKEMSVHEKIVNACSEAGYKDEELDNCITIATEEANKEYEKQRKEEIRLAEIRNKEILKNQQEAKRNQLIEDGRICKGYGFNKGSDAFAACIMHIQETRQQQREYAAQQEYQRQVQQQQYEAARSAAMMQGFTGILKNYDQQQQRVYTPPPVTPQMPLTTECSTSFGITRCRTE